MNLITGESADEFFGGPVSPVARALLRRAGAAAPEARGALLWTAQALEPGSLAIYYALYKYHSWRREFALAERAARRGLAEAARVAGLPEDWSAVVPDMRRDWHAAGPARFWLFTLKALAFICLRDGRREEAARCLRVLQRVAPDARIGDDVIAALLDAGGPRGP